MARTYISKRSGIITSPDNKQRKCSLPITHFSFFIFYFLFFISYFAEAQYFQTPDLLVPYLENAPQIGSQAAVLIDASTGTLLYAKNPDEEIPPASLTKLMTMHLLMKEIEEGRASYDEIVPVTAESWAQSQPPRSSLMFLDMGEIVTLREIMLGLAVSSGNDAAAAAALRLAPSMADFAQLMTQEARRMGLSVTRFTESSGISEHNLTTAAEFAHFCRQYIILHPQSLKDFHSVPEFSYPMAHNVREPYRVQGMDHLPYRVRGIPHTITQSNRNGLLGTFDGVDGLKTGYIDEAGYNIALTAQRDDTRFIAVILGAPARPGGDRIRDADGRRLLSWAFDNFKTVRPDTGEIESPRLWKGKENNVELKLAWPADFTSPLNRAGELIYEYYFPQPLVAPLSISEPAGYLIISDENGELNRVPLLTAQAYEKGNVFKRIWQSVMLMFIK